MYQAFAMLLAEGTGNFSFGSVDVDIVSRLGHLQMRADETVSLPDVEGNAFMAETTTSLTTIRRGIGLERSIEQVDKVILCLALKIYIYKSVVIVVSF